MSFAKQVAAFAKKAELSVEKTIKGVSIKLFSAVIKSSPVDSGRFRANWVASFGNPYTGTSGATDKSGATAISDMASTVVGSKGVSEFTLANNLPYASALEYGGYPGDGPNTVGGFSRQAPAGMVRVNATRFERLLEEEAKKNR